MCMLQDCLCINCLKRINKKCEELEKEDKYDLCKENIQFEFYCLCPKLYCDKYQIKPKQITLFK
jgi:hypothetical protein